MTFATNTQKFSSLLICPLLSFVVGAALSAFAFLAAYMTQLEYGNAETNAQDRSNTTIIAVFRTAGGIEDRQPHHRLPQAGACPRRVELPSAPSTICSRRRRHHLPSRIGQAAVCLRRGVNAIPEQIACTSE
jgi:hypothetical protein